MASDSVRERRLRRAPLFAADQPGAPATLPVTGPAGGSTEPRSPKAPPLPTSTAVLGTLAGLLGRAADGVAARLWRAGHSITANHTADPIHPGTRHRGRVIRSRPEELSQSRSTEFPGGELVSFVLARLTEDREVATAALDATDQPYPPAAPAVAAHHDRHSPNRVLRDVDATTAVAHLWLAAMMRHPDGLPPDSLRDLAEAVLAEFAAVHPDHPDFQRAWLNVSPSPPNDLRQDPNNRPISNVIPFPRNCPT